ncbi:unnamed protein product [Rangifer tarandus platyrhynchus]|uniref:Uncharacterized protein n=2 Tax=Rangifer tarandus platyrhynchus TaxID=3082113 RepID=A0ACB0FBB2_RANTA|nr:unnamed protein product [Rangifer tarandus platyrhynchus]CAI9709773.1 unnamed protein product [Rangifer tarandus platyrhynchus]
MGEKKSLSFSNNCKGQECATVAPRTTWRDALQWRTRLLPLVPGGWWEADWEIASAICPEPRSWSICAFLRGRTVCFYLCHLKAGLPAPKGSARPACCAGALAERSLLPPQDWKGASKRGRSARSSAPPAFVYARPARGLRKGLFKWLPGNKGGPGARLHYGLIGHTGRPAPRPPHCGHHRALPRSR